MVRLLHISDIHLGTKSDAEQYFVALKNDLINELNVNKIDYLLISGDIANKSLIREYAAAYFLVNDLIKTFQIDQSKIVIVPGNHDLSWRLAKNTKFKHFREQFYEEIIEEPYPAHYSKQGLIKEYKTDRILILALNSSWNIDADNPERSGINMPALSSALNQLSG